MIHNLVLVNLMRLELESRQLGWLRVVATTTGSKDDSVYYTSICGQEMSSDTTQSWHHSSETGVNTRLDVCVSGVTYICR